MKSEFKPKLAHPPIAKFLLDQRQIQAAGINAAGIHKLVLVSDCFMAMRNTSPLLVERWVARWPNGHEVFEYGIFGIESQRTRVYPDMLVEMGYPAPKNAFGYALLVYMALHKRHAELLSFRHTVKKILSNLRQKNDMRYLVYLNEVQWVYERCLRNLAHVKKLIKDVAHFLWSMRIADNSDGRETAYRCVKEIRKKGTLSVSVGDHECIVYQSTK